MNITLKQRLSCLLVQRTIRIVGLVLATGCGGCDDPPVAADAGVVGSLNAGSASSGASSCIGHWIVPVSFKGPMNVCAHASDDTACRRQCDQTNIPRTEACVAAGKVLWESESFTVPALPGCGSASSLKVEIRADNHSDSCGVARVIAEVVDAKGTSIQKGLVSVDRCKGDKEYTVDIYGVEVGTGSYKLRLSSEQAGDWILIVRNASATVLYND